MKAKGNGTTTVIAHVEIDGLHKWGTQPRNRPHKYLKAKHRHTFVVELGIPVHHDDRSVEFFAVEQDVRDYLIDYHAQTDGLVDFGNKSCEMIAREVAEHFGADWVEVREDGKGGARYARK